VDDDEAGLDELLAEDDDASRAKAAMAAASRFVKKIDMDFSCLDFSNPALQVPPPACAAVRGMLLWALQLLVFDC
jgi:hypothetical protein